MKKLFDLRFVIGLFFLTIGIILVLYSFTTLLPEAKTIDRWCGSIFMLFSIIMLLLSFRLTGDSEN